jgi:hypothetical protein
MGVEFGMGAYCVTHSLDEAALFRAYAKAIRTDNGPESAAKALLASTEQRKFEHILIESGQSTLRI